MMLQTVVPGRSDNYPRRGTERFRLPMHPQRTHAPLAERLRRRLLLDPATGCLEWQGVRAWNGYGYIGSGGQGGRTLWVHRVAYELANGAIPDGLVIDHLCRNRRCCEVTHLEPVTRLENVRRGIGHGKETHCPQGHGYTPENTYTDKRNRRSCKACAIERERRRRK